MFHMKRLTLYGTIFYVSYPRRMRCRVTVVVLSVCVSVTTLTAAYLVYMSKVRQYTISCKLLKICIVWTSLKMFCSGDVALFVCHDHRQLRSFSTENTPMVLDMITNGTVYELLARSDDYLNRQLDSLIMTSSHGLSVLYAGFTTA